MIGSVKEAVKVACAEGIVGKIALKISVKSANVANREVQSKYKVV